MHHFSGTHCQFTSHSFTEEEGEKEANLWEAWLPNLMLLKLSQAHNTSRSLASQEPAIGSTIGSTAVFKQCWDSPVLFSAKCAA